jgi:glycerophosphoryl diester phosphodiesterase
LREKLVAHRGNASQFAENSIEAIVSALDMGLSYVEIDVQLSSDGVPVLTHDADLRRVYRLDRLVSDTEAVALRSLGIASLAQAIDVIDQRATVFVEIKTDALKRFGCDVAVSRVCQELGPHCVVISFDREAVLTARAWGFRVGLVMSDLSQPKVLECMALEPEYVFCDQRHIQRKVWEGPIWVSYEITDAPMATRVLRHGVQLLETMNPGKLLQ